MNEEPTSQTTAQEEPPRRLALISVTKKEPSEGIMGIVEFARRLFAVGFDITASGGTADLLEKNGVPVIPTKKVIGGYARDLLTKAGVAITPQIEEDLGGSILGHQVATASREILGAILAKPEQREERERLGIPKIHLTCIDYYPMETAIATPGITLQQVRDKIDVGGPHNVHATAKAAFDGSIVICDPHDRGLVIEALEKNEGHDLSQETKMQLAAKAEFTNAKYHMALASYLGGDRYDAVFGEKKAEGKGENGPQSPSIFYDHGGDNPLAHVRFIKVEGNEPGHVNQRDYYRLLQTLTHAAAAFELNLGSVPLLACGAKHGNPCGAASGNDRVTVLRKMLEGSLKAIFGGFIMTTFPIDQECAETLLRYKKPEDAKRRKLDGIVAPAFSHEAIEMLPSKLGTCRLIVNPALADLGLNTLATDPLRIPVRNGHLKQGNYAFVPDFRESNPDIKIYGEFDKSRLADLVLAYAVCATSNSNTITIVKDDMLIGNGAGQQARDDAAWLAVSLAKRNKHKEQLQGGAGVSDSFFPFPDGPAVLIKAGINLIFATSGSKNDHLTIKLCQRKGVTLIMMPDSLARMFFGH